MQLLIYSINQSPKKNSVKNSNRPQILLFIWQQQKKLYLFISLSTFFIHFYAILIYSFFTNEKLSSKIQPKKLLQFDYGEDQKKATENVWTKLC